MTTLLQHDVNNALGAIIGYGELIDEGDAGEVPDRVLTIVTQMVAAARSLAESMQTIAVAPAALGLAPDHGVESTTGSSFARTVTAGAYRLLHDVSLAFSLLEEDAEPGTDSELKRFLLAIKHAAKRVLQIFERHAGSPLETPFAPHRAGLGSVSGSFVPVQVDTAAPLAQDVAGGRVLVVDDAPVNRNLLRHWLVRFGYQVESAEGGRAALNLPHLGAFDAILLDLVMPDLDGITVLRALKADAETAQIPVIIVSGHTDTNRLAQCLDAGADDFLAKPINSTLLRARVRSSVRRKWQLDEDRRHRDALNAEQQRSDELLRNILPSHVIEALRSSGRVASRRIDQVAVVFCDIVGFTSYCEHHAPEMVVAYLDDLYRRLETICAAHGLEKIKTIGDSFMAAAGLDERTPEPAIAALRCSLDFVAAAAAAGAGWDVRVGVALGPVVAGVVGGMKYAYDLWGDTVNTAARIEGLALASEVWCCERTQAAVRDRLDVRFAGAFTAKGKGQINIYSVVGPATAQER